MQVSLPHGGKKQGAVAVYNTAQLPAFSTKIGEIVLWQDTYDGVNFCWALEFRPDLDPTYPWRNIDSAYANVVEGIWAVKKTESDEFADTNVDNGTWRRVGSIKGAVLSAMLPRAGKWRASPQMSWHSNVVPNAWTQRVGLNKSSSTAPASSDGTNDAYVEHAAGAPVMNDLRFATQAQMGLAGAITGRQSPKEYEVAAGESLHLWYYNTTPAAGTPSYGLKAIYFKPEKIA